MDVQIFNPNAVSYQNLQPETCFKRHEQEKCRQYDQRVREVEHASFSPLVFSTSGGMGRSTMKVYKRLAHLLSVKRDESYNHVICCMAKLSPFLCSASINNYVPLWIYH